MSSACATRTHPRQCSSNSTQYLRQYPTHVSQNFTSHSACRPQLSGHDNRSDLVSITKQPRAYPRREQTPAAPESSTKAARSLNHVAECHGNNLRRKTPHGVLDAGYDGASDDLCAKEPAPKRLARQPLGSPLLDTNAMANLELSPKDPRRQPECIISPHVSTPSWDGHAYIVRGGEINSDGSSPGTSPWSRPPHVAAPDQSAKSFGVHFANPSMVNPVAASALELYSSLPYTSVGTGLEQQSIPRNFQYLSGDPSVYAIPTAHTHLQQVKPWTGPSVDSAASTRFFASAEAQLLQDAYGRGREKHGEKEHHVRIGSTLAWTSPLATRFGPDPGPGTVPGDHSEAPLRFNWPSMWESPFTSSALMNSGQVADLNTVLEWGCSIRDLLCSRSDLPKQRKLRTGSVIYQHNSMRVSNASRALRGTRPQHPDQMSAVKGSRHSPALHQLHFSNNLQQSAASQHEIQGEDHSEPKQLWTRTSSLIEPHRGLMGQLSSPRRMSSSEKVDSMTNCRGPDLMRRANEALEILILHCSRSNATWIEGMALAGSLYQALGDHDGCVHWCSRVLQLDGSHVEAMSSLAASMLCLNRRSDAETYWRAALRIRPGFLEAAEQLVALLCASSRRDAALELIEYVCANVQLPEFNWFPPCARSRQHIPNPVSDYHAIYPPGSDGIEQFIRLLYAKGNLLYGSQDYHGAAMAFEYVVLIAVKDCLTLAELISLILRKTSRVPNVHGNVEGRHRRNEPVLLTPEEARDTAKLCFAPHGDLPGLRNVRSLTSRSSAQSIVSNSLLSLAKIFQDTVASAAVTCSNARVAYQVCDILALYYLSFALQPSPSTANNVGILLASFQQTSVSPQQGLTNMILPGITPGSGVWLAFLYYQYGLELDPRHAHLYTNLGSLLKDLGQLPAAVNMYQRAVECDFNFDIALANLANALKDQGKTGDAIFYYKRAVLINPNFCEPVCGLANALNSICSWAGRGGVRLDNGRLDRWHVDENGALVDSRTSGKSGSGWMRRVIDIVNSQLLEGEGWGAGVLLSDASIDTFVAQLLRHSPDASDYEQLIRSLRQAVVSWSGKKNEGAKLVWLVERATRLTTWRWYQDKHVNHTEQSLEAYTRPQLPPGLPALSAPTVLPFHTFTIPMTAKQVRMISQRNGLRMSTPTLRSPWLPKTVFPPPPPPKPYLVVGYVSSDFNNHPLAHLMQSVFGFHDHRRVKAICYATTPSDHSTHRHKIETEAPLFRDASAWSTERLVHQIVDDRVHILVNLNGYTRGARNEVFAARPAPIQMSLMGFAGTLGAEWCDYILADDTAVPLDMLRPWRRNVDLEDLVEAENRSSANDEWVYGENIMYTRGSLFCCDHRQSGSAPGERQVTWEDEVRRRWKMRKELFPCLNDDAIIFGNFNQLYKIDPTTFRTWLRILSLVPNAVLWLLRFPDLGESQLRATARAWSVPEIASRIIFTDVAPKSVHIARACVIDLFLDTPECNAHTTAADCLWSGTPLLTLPRYAWKMASRMAAGILGGALDRSTKEGRLAWEELVVSSEEEYEETAVRLGRGLCYMKGGHGKAEGRLVELRKLLWENRWRKGGLFDTQSWVSDVEDAYEEAWRRWVAGEGGDIRLAELPRGNRGK